MSTAQMRAPGRVNDFLYEENKNVKDVNFCVTKKKFELRTPEHEPAKII